MSFQDFGKPGAGRRDGNNKAADFHSLTPIAEKNSGGWNKQGGGGAPNSYAQVSDGVLQYRVSPYIIASTVLNVLCIFLPYVYNIPQWNRLDNSIFYSMYKTAKCWNSRKN